MTNTPTVTPKPTSSRYRWVICALLFWVTTANYIDRSVFSNLAPELQQKIGWTEGDYWNMTIAFQIAYAVSGVVAGAMIDKLGLKWGFTLAVAFWGVASLGHALVNTVSGFFIVRILLGLGEGGNFPAAIKAVAEWFPRRERALATGLFNSGTNLGGVIVPWGLPIVVTNLGAIMIFGHHLGWRGAFLITGTIDLAWIIAWLACYRHPSAHPRVSKEELDYIQSEPAASSIKVPWLRLVGYRQAWAFIVVKGMTDCMWWFYLFGAPTFFADRFGLSLEARGGPIACIYIVSSLGSVAGGLLSGKFLKMGWSPNLARKISMLIFAVSVTPVFFAGITHSAWTAVGLITLAACAHQAWSANVFSLSSDMFPSRVVASIVGMGGAISSVGSVLFWIWVKSVRKAALAQGHADNFVPIFAVVSCSYLVALLFCHLLSPRLKPANIDEKAIQAA